MLTNNKNRYSWFIMLIDVLIINISIIMAFLLRFDFSLPEFNFRPYTELFVAISLGALFFFNIYGLYSFSARTRWEDLFYSVVLAVILTLMLSISLSYVSANYSFPRSVFLLSGCIQTMLMTLWRYLLWRITKKAVGIQKAIIIGGSDDARQIADRVHGFRESHLEIVGIIITDDITTSELVKSGYKVLGPLSAYERILATREHDLVIIAPSLYLSIKEKIIYACYEQGKEVLLVPDLYEVLLVRADLSLIDDLPLFSVKDQNGSNDKVKRSIDLLFGTIGLLISLPIMALVAIAVKLDSPGSIIYKQERVTKGGKIFTVYKFRTMVQDAEANTGPVFAVEDDQRATRVGRFLRLSRLDELPQFVNVIKGDMSLVGPRPERPVFVEQYAKEINGYNHRLRIKPGITGIAQVAGKYDTGPREKLIFDLLYAKKNSLLVDMQILLNTVKVLFMRDKAS